MSDKIARLGIERDNDMMYYIKNGDVWATPRKQPGKPKGKAQKVASTGLDLDYSRYLYFLDSDGDVARKERASGGGGRRSKKAKANGNGKSNGTRQTPRSSISGHYVTKATAERHPRTTVTETVRTGRGPKTEAQLDAEIEECLAQKRAGRGGNGNGNGNGARSGNGSANGGNGAKSARQPARGRKRR